MPVSHDVMAQMRIDNPRDFFAFIQANGYRYVRVMPDGSIAAIMGLMFTDAIVSGLNECGYEDRWCYAKTPLALAAFRALTEWSGEDGTEPQGWHRHPPTGRRRPDGKPDAEYINR